MLTGKFVADHTVQSVEELADRISRKLLRMRIIRIPFWKAHPSLRRRAILELCPADCLSEDANTRLGVSHTS